MNIVKVQYLTDDDRLSDRAYTYYSEEPLKVGDIVIVPVRDSTGKAKVSAVGVPETEIEAFKDKIKTIPTGSIQGSVPTVPAHPFDSLEECKIAEGVEFTEVNDWPPPMEPPTTAVIKIAPEQDMAILSLLVEANQLRDYAIARVIASDNDMSLAVNDLSIIANVKKALTAKKAEYSKPIKAHLDAIGAAFQMLLTPIEDADRITRETWRNYRNEQTKRKAEADVINRQKEELARREAALNQGEITVDTTPVKVPMPVAKVHTDMGTAGIIKNRKYRIVNFALLPDEYKTENSVLLNRVAKIEGHPAIPGVEFYIEEGLRVTSSRPGCHWR